MPQHVLSLRDLDTHALHEIMRLALDIKAQPQRYSHALDGKVLTLLFEKTSTRTTLSYQAGMAQLGGHSVVLHWQNSNFTISPIAYETQYVSRNCDVIMARLKSHEDVRTMAQNSQVPLINGCDDRYHPSQALADFLTIHEVAGGFDGVTLAYVGVRNNVTNSLMEAALTFGVNLLLVTPEVQESAQDADLEAMAASSGLVRECQTVAEAATLADFIYTDTWVDMEHFNDPEYAPIKEARIQTMLPYQLNHETLGPTAPYVMHDMPMHPGYEISAELIEDPRAVIYQQAENRMHAQKALLLHLLASGN